MLWGANINHEKGDAKKEKADGVSEKLNPGVQTAFLRGLNSDEFMVDDNSPLQESEYRVFCDELVVLTGL